MTEHHDQDHGIDRSERRTEARCDAAARHRRRRRNLLIGLLVVAALATTTAVVAGFDLFDRPPQTHTAGMAEKAATGSQPTDESASAYASLRARGKAKSVLRAARSQMGIEYVYGAGPRDPDGLARIGLEKHRAGFDCSSFVAYAFQQGAGQWVSGTIAHTDQIWTQGGQLPLTSTPGSTATIIRGTGAKPPRSGYKPGDILLTRWGAGGYWGHVVIVSERGFVIESFPPDVHEDTRIEDFLAEGRKLGWVRVRSLQA